MKNETFIGYLHSEDVHDGSVCAVNQDGDRLEVLVKSVDGRLVKFEFSNVRTVRMNRAEGMVLYSLTEMEETPPYRKFCFTNWDETDDAYLEVVAREMRRNESL